MVIKLDFNSVTGRFNLNIFLAGGVSPWRPVRLEALSWRAVLLEAFSWRVVRLEAPEKFDNWRNVLLEKCLPWRRVRLEACPPGGVSSWRLVRWRDDCQPPCSPIGSGRIRQFVERCQVRYHIGDLEVSLTHQQYYNHNLAVRQFVS